VKVLKSKKIIILFLSLTIAALSSEAFALEVLDKIPSPTGRRLSDSSSLTDLVAFFYEWGIALGGIAAFIALIIGGFQYLTSMGEPARLADAKDRIKSAFFGLILLLSSWLILNTINPQLTTLVPPAVNPPGEELEPIPPPDVEPPKPCEYADVCRSIDFGNCDTVKPGEGKKETRFNPLSVNIEPDNACVVILYGEGDEVKFILTADARDLSDLGIEDVKYTKVISMEAQL